MVSPSSFRCSISTRWNVSLTATARSSWSAPIVRLANVCAVHAVGDGPIRFGTSGDEAVIEFGQPAQPVGHRSAVDYREGSLAWRHGRGSLFRDGTWRLCHLADDVQVKLVLEGTDVKMRRVSLVVTSPWGCRSADPVTVPFDFRSVRSSLEQACEGATPWSSQARQDRCGLAGRSSFDGWPCCLSRS